MSAHLTMSLKNPLVAMQDTSVSPRGWFFVINACRTLITYKAYPYAAANLHSYQPVTCRRRIMRTSFRGALLPSALNFIIVLKLQNRPETYSQYPFHLESTTWLDTFLGWFQHLYRGSALFQLSDINTLLIFLRQVLRDTTKFGIMDWSGDASSMP